MQKVMILRNEKEAKREATKNTQEHVKKLAKIEAKRKEAERKESIFSNGS